MIDYVWGPTPHDNFSGVAQRRWSGQICDMSNLFEFFFFFVAFFVTRTCCISSPIGTIYIVKLIFLAKDVPFGGLDNIWLYLGSQSPPKKKTPQNWPEKAFRSQTCEIVK